MTTPRQGAIAALLLACAPTGGGIDAPGDRAYSAIADSASGAKSADSSGVLAGIA